MLLTVDIGNTDTKFGVFDKENLIFTARLSSVRGKTFDQYAVEMKQIFAHKGVDFNSFSGSIISSVVPELTETIKLAINDLTATEPLIVGPGIKTGINILIDQPRQLGADLLVGAVAAAEKYPLPCYVVDLGTATKISVVGKDKSYCGCTIAPGVTVSLDALSNGASQLFSIPLDTPSKAVGTNTIDCMQSGIIFGTASMIDGMIQRFNDELGIKAFVVATGGNAGRIIPHCRETITLDKHLLLHGLRIIYNKNT